MKCFSSKGTLVSKSACFMGTSGVPQRILRQIVYSGKDEPTPGDHLWRSWVDNLTTFRVLGPESSFLVDVVVHDVGEHTEVVKDEPADIKDDGWLSNEPF